MSTSTNHASIMDGISSGKKRKADTQPQRLEPTVSPADGSLLCTPLSTVILAACEALYDDLKQMIQGSILVASSTGTAGDTAAASTVVGNNSEHPSQQQPQQQQQQNVLVQMQEAKMSNLSYAQRRHELTLRLTRHTKAISHIIAIVSAYCGAYANIDGPVERFGQRCVTDSVGSGLLAECIQVANQALKHVFEAWNVADEAQNELFYGHSFLWSSRKQCHDIYGACDVFLSGAWRDLPSDVQLIVDPYEKSTERHYSKEETNRRLQSCLLRKIVLGELGETKRLGRMNSFPWENVILEKSGGILKLTWGAGKIKGLQNHASVDLEKYQRVYPVEARLTILDESEDPEWTLLSLDISCASKTGESTHQIEANDRQKMNLHRICAKSMQLEEERARKRNNLSLESKNTVKEFQKECDNKQKIKQETKVIARPLERLFHLASSFLMSQQLEILSAQAIALRRGVWGGKNGIHVSSVHYVDGTDPSSRSNQIHNDSDSYAEMTIHFWAVDTRFGAPRLFEVNSNTNATLNLSDSQNKISNINNTDRNDQKLRLNIRSFPKRGLILSLSGGKLVMDLIDEGSNDSRYLKKEREKMISSVIDPFELSAADAILAASVLSAHLRALAVAKALNSPAVELPRWLKLGVEYGTVSIAVQIASVSGNGMREYSSASEPYVEIFRLCCDSRNGRFIPTFPESSDLLRSLACNDPSSSGIQQQIRKRAGVKRKGSGIRTPTGRLIKDAFDGICRSIDIVGKLVGVGGEWDDNDTLSASLRKREVERSCIDVKSALMMCSGISVTYGITCLALKLASGIDPVADMTGGIIREKNSIEIPPLGLLLSQTVSEISVATEKKMRPVLRSELLGITSHPTSEFLHLSCYVIKIQMDSPRSEPERLEYREINIGNFNISRTDESQANHLDVDGKFYNKSNVNSEHRPLIEIASEMARNFDKVLKGLLVGCSS